MRVLRMDPDAHDRFLAQASHLPHIAAAALVRLVGPEVEPLVGTGWADTTRIASGDPGLWRDILMTNPDGIAVALDRFNRVAFDPVQTDALRLEVQSAKGKSAGLFEWRALSGRTNLAPSAKITKSFNIRMGRNNRLSALNDGEGASRHADLVDVRELHGYTPWYFNLPEPGRGYEVAWRQLMDRKGFFAPFGPTTAEQRHPGFKVSYEGHDCQWNGPSWPYATSVTLTALANVLNNYPQQAVTKNDYFKVLKIYAASQRRTLPDGRVVPWIDENLNPFTGDWIARTRCEQHNAELLKAGHADRILRERGKDYNHSTFCDLVISGLIGLRPRPDDTVVVHPLIPDGRWDWFCLDHIAYHGRTLTILWDRTGEKYGRGRGLRVFADGRLIAQSDTLGRVTGTLGP